MKSSPSPARAYLAWFISALPGIIARAAIMNRRCNCSVREWMYLNVNYVNELKEMMARQLQYFFVSAAIWLILLAATHIAYTLLRYHSSQTSISESSRFSQNILFHTKIYFLHTFLWLKADLASDAGQHVQEMKNLPFKRPRCCQGAGERRELNSSTNTLKQEDKKIEFIFNNLLAMARERGTEGGKDA